MGESTAREVYRVEYIFPISDALCNLFTMNFSCVFSPCHHIPLDMSFTLCDYTIFVSLYSCTAN